MDSGAFRGHIFYFLKTSRHHQTSECSFLFSGLGRLPEGLRHIKGLMEARLTAPLLNVVWDIVQFLIVAT